MQKSKNSRVGFALPTVLIASVVMLTVLTVSVSSVVAVRTALMTQYYEQLAKTAGEAGVAYAKACLAKNGNIPLWSNEKPLTPSTDCAGNSLLNPQVQVLVVAGGGGGGAGIGGGGGGGGVVEDTAYNVTPGTYPVTVGGGGAGGVSTAAGAQGGNSSFNNAIVAIGGGGGAGRINGSSFNPAGDGGSGGGGNGTYDPGTGTGSEGGSAEPGQGNVGGMGSGGTASPYAGNGGGGGGAGSAGTNALGVLSTEGYSGDGGNGRASQISGNTTFYGAGGSGGRWGDGTIGIEGYTGGGKGAGGDAATGAAGMANTGGGGGGGSSGAGNGGAGGSGVVIVRYPTDGSISATTTGGSVDSQVSGAYQIKVFRGNGNLVITNTATPSCPANPKCAVAIEGNARSMFSIGTPILNSDGRAIAIPNTGYVELLRSSNNEVWRTYRQPGVQAVVVPDLCSGAASSSLGWSNASLSTPRTTLPTASGAQSITLSDTELYAGQMYFRRDFPVVTADTYNVIASTANASDKVEIYVDGVLRTTAQGGVTTGFVALGVGCHTITARLTNQTIVPSKSAFVAAVQRQGSSEAIVATDADWRVSAGSPVDFSNSDFYADPAVWGVVTDHDAAINRQAGWSVASDPYARFISSANSGCVASCPASSYTYLRNSRDFVTTGDVEVRISALCDDDCSVYIDGNLVIENSPWPNINQQTLTLTAGTHRIGLVMRNGAVGQSAAAISVFDKTNNVTISRTDNRWQAAASWFGGTGTDIPLSYEDSFLPSPNEIARPVILETLIVGGGGGGGGACATCAGGAGGGGGGVVLDSSIVPTNGLSLNVVVGGGGAGGVGGASRLRGTVGGNSSIRNSSNVVLFEALGGGGGGAQATSNSIGGNGGSGGGGSGGNSPPSGVGGNGTNGQGGSGGAGSNASIFGSGGGGGSGGSGTSGSTTINGNGGPGYMNSFGSAFAVFGAGGGAGAYNTTAPGTSDIGAGDGVNQSINVGVGYPGTANTGGGGGGANGSTQGKAGGNGGSGVVIIRYVKGKITATGGTQSDHVVNGITYRVHRFSANGTFTISSVTP